MAQSIIWSGGKPYEYVDGSLQEIQAPQTYTMPDGTRFTYGPDGTPQALPAGQTSAALAPSGTGIGVPQFLLNQGQNVSTNDVSPLGGSTGWGVGDQIYSGSQWYGEPGASPWGSDTGSTFNKYENTPALRAASESGKFSALNGSPYQTLDANGNVTGSGNWSNLKDSNSQMTDAAVVALVGAALGGIGAYGGAAGAAGASGSGAGAAGASGAGVTGFGDAGLMYGGADAAAAGSLGGGASVAGGSALGTGAAGAAGAGAAGSAGSGAGVTGFGDAGTMYGGADAASAGSLGGGASVNGGAALGSGTSAMGAGGSGGSGGMGSGASTTGTPPPANPALTGAGGAGALGGLGNILSGNGSASDYAGLLASIGGAYLGSQGEQNNSSSTFKLDPRLDAAVYGSLVPNVMSTMNGQIPGANAAGQQLMSVGSGLLGTSSTPNFANNPYLTSVADEMGRRTSLLLGDNNLAIQGNAVASGGLGGSRQGVAQGVAAGRAADSLQGNLANLYQTQYNTDAQRALQQQALGAGMIAQGQQAPWVPLSNANSIFGNYKSGTSTTTNSQGGGLSGALGGLLGGAQWAQNSGALSSGSGGGQTSSWW